MIALAFHRDLYPGETVDAVAKLFEGHARIALEESPSHWIVRVTAEEPEFERTVAGELGNYALGVAVRERGKAA